MGVGYERKESTFKESESSIKREGIEQIGYSSAGFN
jgi:hypothetical protein